MDEFEERRKPVKTIGGIIATILILFFISIIIIPWLHCSPPPQSNRARCMSNLKRIGIASLQYALDNNDILPFEDGIKHCQTLGKLHPVYVSGLNVFSCPSSKDSKWNEKSAHIQNNNNSPFSRESTAKSLSYAYGFNRGKPWTTKDASSTRIAADKYATQDYTKGDSSRKPGNHQTAGRNVVYLDGSARWDINKGLLEADPETEYEKSGHPESDQTGTDWWSDPPEKK